MANKEDVVVEDPLESKASEKNPCIECEGTCCRLFVTPFDIEKVKQSKDDDVEKILKYFVCVDDLVAPLLKAKGKLYDYQYEHFYTCSALKDGKCSIYDDRPYLCRKFKCHRLHGDRSRFWGTRHDVAMIIFDKMLDERIKDVVR